MGSNAAIAMVGLGAGLSASANRESGKSQQALNNYNSEVYQVKADDAIARGKVEEANHRTNTQRLIGSQRAAFGASGAEVNDPGSTASNVFSDTAYLSEIDALTIRSNAAREAWGFKAAAKDATYRGEIAKAEGDNRAIGSLTSAAGSVFYSKFGFSGGK